MSRLSREKKREQKRADAGAGAVAPVPLEVRVPGPGAAGASIGGVPVVAADGEEIQHAVLRHLHRIALATSHPILATIHDTRIGYVVPLRMETDGSSHFTAEPARFAPQGVPEVPGEEVGFGRAAEVGEEAQAPSADGPRSASEPGRDERTHLLRQAPEPVKEAAPTFRLRALSETPATDDPAPALPTAPEPQDAVPGTVTAPTGVFGPPPAMDTPLEPPTPREPFAAPAPTPSPTPEPSRGPVAEPTPGRGPEPTRGPMSEPTSAGGPEPAPGLVSEPTPVRVPEPVPGIAPVSVSEPTPVRVPEPVPGIAPVSVSEPTPVRVPEPAPGIGPVSVSEPTPAPVPEPGPSPVSEPADSRAASAASASTPTAAAASASAFLPAPALDPDPKPTPARGFDAVAEAVLGDDPRTVAGADGAPGPLADPMSRINEAVKAGRIDAAAEIAERTVGEASGTLGPEHPEVLRLRELTAYVAYLAGDPLRALHLSLDLARIHRRAGDAEAAYGNVLSAAAAWRAVRDPFQGLNLGTELLVLWTELTTEDGPAADDAEQLESARARMVRLAGRARAQQAGQ